MFGELSLNCFCGYETCPMPKESTFILSIQPKLLYIVIYNDQKPKYKDDEFSFKSGSSHFFPWEFFFCFFTTITSGLLNMDLHVHRCPWSCFTMSRVQSAMQMKVFCKWIPFAKATFKPLMILKIVTVQRFLAEHFGTITPFVKWDKILSDGHKLNGKQMGVFYNRKGWNLHVERIQEWKMWA